MANASYEDAKRCPRCSSVGNEVSKVKAPGDAGRLRGAKIHTLECPSELCPARDMKKNEGRGEGFRWLVQVNRDGSVPVREAGEKQFELPGWVANQARRDIDEAKYIASHPDAELDEHGNLRG